MSRLFNHSYWSVYFIAGTQDVLFGEAVDTFVQRQQRLLTMLESALRAGVTCFQFREKGQNALSNETEIAHLAQACQSLCRAYHVPFFINDNVQLAKTLHADGIHVGQADQAIERVIAACAGQMHIGLSVNNFAQAKATNHLTAVDYLGVGPIYTTTSKPDAQPAVGLALLQQIKNQDITKPLVAIGGINADNAADVRLSGADGVAVISAITQATDRVWAVEQLK